MAQQLINIGLTPNDKSGDLIRTAFNKVNQNFTELFVQDVPTSSLGKAGDTVGMFSLDETYVYFCIETFSGNSNNIWKRITLENTW